MSYDIFMGIDVGSEGSITCLHPDGSIFSVQKLPKKDVDSDFESDILKMFGQYEGVDIKVVVERIWSRPGNNATRAFTSGRMYGSIITSIAALSNFSNGNVELEQHTSGKWQKMLKGKYGWTEKSTDYEYIEWKRILKAKAQLIFPDEEVTLWKADSMLIAHYCHLLYKNIS